MGTWWRSEEMSYVSLIMTEEAAQSCIRELGILGCMQFVDLNPELTPFQREYVANIKRCDEIERKIRYIFSEVKKLGLMSSTTSATPTVEDFIAESRRRDTLPQNSSSSNMGGGSGAYILETLEGRLDAHEVRLRELVDYNTTLSAQYTNKVEYHYLLVQAHKIVRAVSEIEMKEAAAVRAGNGVPVSGDGLRFGSSFSASPTVEDGEATNPLLLESKHGGFKETARLGSKTGGGSSGAYQEGGGSTGDNGEELIMSFSNVSGVIAASERARFERMLFRSTRGNCYVRFAPLSSRENVALDADGKPIEKLAFVIFYKSATIESKITRICDAFGATRYNLEMLNRPQELDKLRHVNYQDLMDSKTVLDKNTSMRSSICESIAESLQEWLWVVRREKSVYHALNLCKSDVAGRFLRARGWIMNSSVAEAKQAIYRAHLLLNLPQNSLLELVSGSWPVPPTHFQTNKYTYAFQEFVNTYGIPRYREINPALFTAATFPFLFGVMYGDIGHGTVLTVASLYLVMTESKLRSAVAMDDMLRNVYSARYMLLAMGLCSIYAGLIYNDYFSLGLNIFGSSYKFQKPDDQLQIGDKAVLAKGTASGDPEAVYPFGIDPVWHVSGNELLFFNSMKMKMSVILGITQMTWGIILRGVNSYYAQGFGLDFMTEFVPMIIFDVGLFGYMIVLIFVKWGINWNERMALGSCQYNAKGVFGACHLSDADTKFCYSVQGLKCTSATPLAEVCPLDYGGSGDGCQPPNLITTLINIVLKPGQVDDPLFPGQARVQTIILAVAFLCVPWLLCAKPYILKRRHQAKHADADALGEHGSHSLHGHGASATDRLMDNVSEHNYGYDHGAAELNPLHTGFGGSSGKNGKGGARNVEMRNLGSDNTAAAPAGLGKYGMYDLLPFNTGSRFRSASEEGSNDRSPSHSAIRDFSSALPGNGGYNAAEAGHGHGDEEEFNFGEIVIHQAIETIEFVLGMVSNTASYLRLWALSLAHSELSQVFWEKCLVGAIESGNPIAIFLGFGVFAAITTAVLLFMDVLECFLHALRLHWVEFQNKFYKADGQRFVPFDFKEILVHAKID